MILHDQHIHSSFSFDSEEDLRNYYLKAKENNINYVITTEHIDYMTSYYGFTWDVDFEKFLKKQEVLKKEFPNITSLLGVELGYRKDFLKDMNEISNKYNFDLIQLSIHDSGLCDYYFKEAFSKGVYETLNEYYDLIIEAINTFSNYDVLSHIGFGFKTALMINPSIKVSEFEDKLTIVLSKIIKDNKALEINSKVLKTINDIYKENDEYYRYDDHLRYILCLYKKLGGTKLTLSSDAHNISCYKLDFDKHILTIKECGFNKLSYFIKRKEYLYDL